MLSDKLDAEKWLALNSKLQQKKQALRKALHERGPVQKDKTNNFDRYTYLSEAAYKRLFDELLPANSLELMASCSEVEKVPTSGNQKNGVIAKWAFTLTDTETGFGEGSVVFGEGWDKGDKAIYKAHTGALKYYLAQTFMVASGEDAESDKGDEKSGQQEKHTATPNQIEKLYRLYTEQEIQKACHITGVQQASQLPFEYTRLMIAKKERNNENHK